MKNCKFNNNFFEFKLQQIQTSLNFCCYYSTSIVNMLPWSEEKLRLFTFNNYGQVNVFASGQRKEKTKHGQDFEIVYSQEDRSFGGVGFFNSAWNKQD